MAGNGGRKRGVKRACGRLEAVFGGEMATAKILSSLDRLDSRNGAKCRLLFVIGCGIIFSSTSR